MKRAVQRSVDYRIIADTGLLFASLWLALSAWWVVRSFAGISINKIIYHLTTSLQASSDVLVGSYIKWALAVPLAVSLVYAAARVLAIRLKPPVLSSRHHTGIVGAILVASLFSAVVLLRIPTYVFSLMHPSTFIEANYIDPHGIEIVFPEDKPNLIFVFLESMENTYADTAHGGIEPVSLIPHLTEIAQEPGTISFSHATSSLLGGFHDVEGTSWTAGAMVAQTSGMPLLITLRNALILDVEEFLPGVQAIGDVLAEQGYRQTLMVGSYADFGQRRVYFETHGDYRIFDLEYVLDRGLLTDTSGSWGFNDRFLYMFARDEITQMAQEGQPFNFTMLTVDTHSPDGDLCPLCRDEFDMQYKNVVACADRQIAEFLAWAKSQTWYEDTVIMVVSDHLSMDPLYSSTIPTGYVRTNFNVIINAKNNSEDGAPRTRQRVYTALDIYPTTLAAMGSTIEGNRLALGTDLFGAEPTLAEQYGLTHVDEEFSRYSRFYDRNILQVP